MCTHATGTIAGDSAEINSFEKLTQSIGKKPLICSFKGYLGHSLSSSGLVELMLMIKCLKEGKVPPICNLKNPISTNQNLARSTMEAKMRVGLKACSGFGGVNYAVLSRIVV